MASVLFILDKNSKFSFFLADWRENKKFNNNFTFCIKKAFISK